MNENLIKVKELYWGNYKINNEYQMKMYEVGDAYINIDQIKSIVPRILVTNRDEFENNMDVKAEIKTVFYRIIFAKDSYIEISIEEFNRISSLIEKSKMDKKYE